MCTSLHLCFSSTTTSVVRCSVPLHTEPYFSRRGRILTSLKSQWLFLVPLKGGRWHIIPQLAVYTTYILPSGGLYTTYHLLREPETTIENLFCFGLQPSCLALFSSSQTGNLILNCKLEEMKPSSWYKYCSSEYPINYSLYHLNWCRILYINNVDNHWSHYFIIALGWKCGKVNPCFGVTLMDLLEGAAFCIAIAHIATWPKPFKTYGNKEDHVDIIAIKGARFRYSGAELVHPSCNLQTKAGDAWVSHKI